METKKSSKVRNFEDLVVWQKAHELMLNVYGLADTLPKEERYLRIDQLKRSVSSIPANVAEGFGRYHYQENIQFCRQARGSLEETKNHLIAVRDLEQVSRDECEKLLQNCDELRKLLNGYIFSTKKLQRIGNAVIFFLVSQFLFSSFSITYAATRAYFEGPGHVGINGILSLTVLVDSDEPLNAYQVEVLYPPQQLELVGFADSRSLIGLWQDRPEVPGEGQATFGGGSFTAFKGKGGELLTLYFQGKVGGFTEITFGNTAFYRADGEGTEVRPDTRDFAFTVEGAATPEEEGTGILFGADRTPPEIKVLSFDTDPFNDKRKFLLFLVADKESGVRETLARARSWFFWGRSHEVSNPVAFSKGVWAVEFKAIDNAGNVTRRVLYDTRALVRKLIFGLISAAGVVLAIVINRKRRSTRYNK